MNRINDLLSIDQMISIKGQLRAIHAAETAWTRLNCAALSAAEVSAEVLCAEDTKDFCKITVPLTIYIRKSRRK